MKDKLNNIKLGIIGTGRIAARFVRELEYVDGIELTAVYNPRIESARRFVGMICVGQPTDSLSILFRKADAVYIASPHETHTAYIRQALEAGCHVLCEKPMAFAAQEAEELFSLADSSGLVLMEALKTAYCPGFQRLIADAKSGIIGEIRDVEACFTKLVRPPAPHINPNTPTGTSAQKEYTAESTLVDCSEGQNSGNAKAPPREYTGPYRGSFAELGSYPLLAIISLLGRDYKNLKFYSFRDNFKTDIYTKIFLEYNDTIATAKSGIGVKSEGQLLISGTEGYILCPAPWWLTRSYDVRFEDSQRNYTVQAEFEGDGLRYEIAAFRDSIIGRPPTPPTVQAEFEGDGLRYEISAFTENITEKVVCISENGDISEKCNHTRSSEGTEKSSDGTADDRPIATDMTHQKKHIWQPGDSVALAGIFERFYTIKI